MTDTIHQVMCEKCRYSFVFNASNANRIELPRDMGFFANSMPHIHTALPATFLAIGCPMCATPVLVKIQ